MGLVMRKYYEMLFGPSISISKESRTPVEKAFGSETQLEKKIKSHEVMIHHARPEVAVMLNSLVLLGQGAAVAVSCAGKKSPWLYAAAAGKVAKCGVFGVIGANYVHKQTAELAHLKEQLQHEKSGPKAS